jgi:hypothetical protein
MIKIFYDRVCILEEIITRNNDFYRVENYNIYFFISDYQKDIGGVESGISFLKKNVQFYKEYRCPIEIYRKYFFKRDNLNKYIKDFVKFSNLQYINISDPLVQHYDEYNKDF